MKLNLSSALKFLQILVTIALASGFKSRVFTFPLTRLTHPSLKSKDCSFFSHTQKTHLHMMQNHSGDGPGRQVNDAGSNKKGQNKGRRNQRRRPNSGTTLSHFQGKDFTKPSPNKGKNRNNRISNSEVELKLKRYPLRPSGAPTVAIIGGGISGLACARGLAARGVQAVVYDTGKNEVGGRCSTRVFSKMEPPLVFDHSAQFFTVSDPSSPWGMMVQEMVEAGAVRQWGPGKVGELEDGEFCPKENMVAYVGTEGMRSVAQFLATGSQIERPVWVSKMQRDAQSGGWKLWHYQEFLGTFDYVVIAHNGKCAARLMSTAGKEYNRLYQILNTKFGATLKYPKPRYMQLCSLWVLLAHFDEELPVPENLEGAFVKGSAELSWIANNSAKLNTEGSSGSSWTLISTPQFGQDHKCPQENIPPEHASLVTDKMLRALEESLKIEPGALQPAFSSVQLWGAANPISVTNARKDQPFIFQDSARVGICGDWVLEPSLEAAALSGWKLAGHIDEVSAASEDADGNAAVNCGFVPVQVSSPIGQFSEAEHQTVP